MAWIIIRSVLIGLAALVTVPMFVAIIVLALSYTLDSRCGTPGDSGGCEMGAFTIAVASALPAFAGGFLISLIVGLRGRKRAGGEAS